MTKDELKNIIFKAITDYEKEKEDIHRKQLKELEEKKNNVILDNNKIVLSSDIFCKMVNVIAYAENNELIDPLLNDIVEDVKKNKKILSEKSERKINNVPKQQKNEKYEFHPHIKRIFPLFDDLDNL